MTEISDLFSYLPGFAWRTMADGHADVMNPGMLAYVGEFVTAFRNDWHSCVHPEDVGHFDNDIDGIADADGSYKPARFRRHDGEYRWFQLVSRDSQDGSGALQSRYLIGWDINDRVLASEESRRREVAIATIMDCIPGFVWQLGSTGELNYLNTKVFAYTGKMLEELREPGWRDSVHPEDVESFIAHWTRAMQGRRPIVIEFRLRRFDGVYRWFRTTGEPVLDAQSNVVSWCGVDLDIDDEKRTDQNLRSAQTQLARTAQLAIAAELTASTANAINQPLAAIVANSFACQRWLNQSPAAVDRAAPILDLIVSDSKAVATIVARIMGIIRRSPPAISSFNLNSVIKEVLRLMAEELQESSVAVQMNLDNDYLEIRADAALIKQVLVNLIGNAMDALRDQEDRPREISITAHRIKYEIVVEVTDNGAGFVDNAPLFEAFYTTKPDGLGLGLAISRSIIESYGGRAWAQHRRIGSAVGFSLPISPDQ
jgi:PAS domain S-box-containing protein